MEYYSRVCQPCYFKDNLFRTYLVFSNSVLHVNSHSFISFLFVLCFLSIPFCVGCLHCIIDPYSLSLPVSNYFSTPTPHLSTLPLFA